MRPPYRSSRKHSSQVIEVADRYSPGIQAGDPFFTSEPIWADWFDLHHDARQHLKRTAVRWLRVWWEQGHHCPRLPFFTFTIGYRNNAVFFLLKKCGFFWGTISEHLILWMKWSSTFNNDHPTISNLLSPINKRAQWKFRTADVEKTILPGVICTRGINFGRHEFSTKRDTTGGQNSF